MVKMKWPKRDYRKPYYGLYFFWIPIKNNTGDTSQWWLLESLAQKGKN